MAIKNPLVAKVFDDLDEFRDFCRFEGYVFNEADLYKNSSNVWQSFVRSKNPQKNKFKAKRKF